jgi:phosphatidylglycerophosphatase A
MKIELIKVENKMNLRKNKLNKVKLEYLIATFFGAGFFPKMPGTFASILAFFAPVFFLDKIVSIYIRPLILLFLILIFTLISLKLIPKVEKKEGFDASIIVIDEIIGVWLIYLSPFIPITWLSFLLGIGLFRFFDILKPSIIGKINEKKGAIFVILDDIFAAFFTLILLHFTYFILKFAVFFKIIDFF